MELADDIAYGVHDLEDAIALNFITEKDWQEIQPKIIAPDAPEQPKLKVISNERFENDE